MFICAANIHAHSHKHSHPISHRLSTFAHFVNVQGNTPPGQYNQALDQALHTGQDAGRAQKNSQNHLAF